MREAVITWHWAISKMDASKERYENGKNLRRTLHQMRLGKIPGERIAFLSEKIGKTSDRAPLIANRIKMLGRTMTV